MPSKPGLLSPAEQLFRCRFRLDFEMPGSAAWLRDSPRLHKRLAQLKRGGFMVGDLVLTRRLQTPKGRTPYAGPFRIVKVLGRYSYLLSDGQKWNLRLLKRILPPRTTWIELINPPPIAEGIEVAEGIERIADTDREAQAEAAQSPHRYPTRERLPPSRYSPEDFRKPNAPSRKGK